MLVLAAASDSGELPLLARAGSVLGLELADLAPAESAGLVRIGESSVAFRHPLARSAVYGEATAEERRVAHGALARVLPDRDLDRRAWHLAAAAVGPDEAASAALEQAGARARARSAYTEAAAAFERAARLTLTETARSILLHAAADAAWLAGNADLTVALLDELTALAPEPSLRARVEHLRGEVAFRRGPVMEGYALLIAAAEVVAESEPELAASMLAEAVFACFYSGNTAAMRRAADRGVELALRGSDSRIAFFATIGARHGTDPGR